MQKQTKCLKCGKSFTKWDYENRQKSYNWRPMYTCEECIEDLYRIEDWSCSKIYKKYCKKEKRLLMKINGKAVWTTICPTGDIPLELLHKKIIKLSQGSLVKKGWWAYEWRHNISDWNGPNCVLDNNGLHCHMYCKVNSVNSWQTKVKRLCKSNKWIYNESSVIEMDYPEQDKIDYVKGKTFDSEKNDKKLNKDVNTRIKYKIKHFFDIGFKPWEIGFQLTYSSTTKEAWRGDNPYIALAREREINDTESVNEL